MAKLFVSYSRRDSAAARTLIEAFKSIGQEVWVDWEAIPPAVDWLEQIFRGIEEADAFIFMISPDSIASEVCKVEIGRAVLNNKRIIPIVLRDVDPKTTLEDIRKLNWTYLRAGDNFEEGLAKVRTAIELDLDWLEEHRRLQVRALEWHRKKDTSLLLHGRDLRNARQMVRTYTSKDPTPTELQLKYIEHSRRRERTRTIMWFITGIVVLLLAGLTYAAYRESVRANQNAVRANQNAEIANRNAEAARNNERQARRAQLQAEIERQNALEQERKAREQETIAEAQRSAARAQIYQSRTGELYTSTLMAIDSWIKSPSGEAEEILRKNISLLPLPAARAFQAGGIYILERNENDDTWLSASADGTVCVRRLEAAAEVLCKSVPAPVGDAVFLKGGQSLAVADSTGSVRVWDIQSGEVEWERPAGSPVRDLEVARDGKTLAIAREDRTITIIDVAQEDSQGYTLSTTGTPTATAFSPDGRWFAAGSNVGIVTVWDLNSNKILSGNRHRGEVLALAFSPDGRFVISGGTDHYAVGFDIQLDRVVFPLLHADWVTDIEFPGADSSWFITGSEDGRVRVWDLNTAMERRILFQDGAVADVAISPSGKWIAATGGDGTARVWSADSGVEMYQIPLSANGVRLGFSRDGGRIITGDAQGGLGIWDVSGLAAPAASIEFGKPPWIARFTPDGERLIAAEAGRVWVLDSRSLVRLGTRPPAGAAREFGGDIDELVISPDSQTIGLSTSEGAYFIQDLATRIPLRIEPAGIARALAFSYDSSLFITGTSQGQLETWDSKTGRQTGQIDLPGPIFSLATGPAGVAAGLQDTILLLDPYSEQETLRLPSPGENQFLAFSADGSRLAGMNSAGQVRTWSIRGGKVELLQTLTRERSSSIAFHPRGKVLAVGTVDKVYMIDPLSGMEVSRIPHNGVVYDLSFSPDGELLATASQKLIQVWDVSGQQALRSEDLKEAACSRLFQNLSVSEWTAFFGSDQPYETLCEGIPVPG